MKVKGKQAAIGAICLLCLTGLVAVVWNAYHTDQLKQIPQKETTQKDVSEDESTDYKKIVIAYPAAAAGTKDMEMVAEAVNKFVNEKLGVQLEFRVSNEIYSLDVGRMLVGQEQLDIAFTFRSMQENFVANNMLWQLDSLLEMYGQDIIPQVGEENIDNCRIDGKLYGLPNNRDYAVGWDGYIVNQDLLLKYGIDASKITTLEQLEEVFELIKKKEPGITVVGSSTGNLLNNCYFSMKNIGVHLDNGQSETVSNLFESEEYKQQLERIRRWYLKGYIDPDVLEETESVQKRMKDGTLFAYAYRMKPGVQQQESATCGRKVECIQLGKNIVSNNESSSMQWVITKNSKYPGLAMEVLNLLYSDAEIMNLMSYGIEGIHYVRTEDGHITYPEGKNENIFVGNSWEMPNQFITYVWDGNPLSYWEDIKKFNEDAIQGCDVGFNFNPSPVYTEYLSLQEIYANYVSILGNGLVDPKEGLEKMNKEMSTCFIDEVIKEEQRQFDEWKEKENLDKKAE